MKIVWILVWAGTLVAQNPPAQEAQPAAPVTTLDSILSSTETLNAIRDAYLRRLAGDGCAPDVAIRVAELRARLRARETPSATKKNPTAMSSADMESSLLVLAVSWYTWRPPEAAATAKASSEADRNRLLASVLAPRQAQSAAPKVESVAQLNGELERLLESCRAAKR